MAESGSGPADLFAELLFAQFALAIDTHLSLLLLHCAQHVIGDGGECE